MAFIVMEVGKNPKAAWERGAFFSEEFEVVHVACEDPGLNGKVLAL